MINQIKLLITRRIVFFLLVSLGMTIIHMIFMPNFLPWIDEVMYTDCSIHYLEGDGWITHAWPSNAGRTPMSLVAPVYPILHTCWMWLFGTSIWASRSMNLFIIVLIGTSLLRLSERFDFHLGELSAIVLALLLWCTPAMSFMYRDGRADLLGAFFCVLLFIQVIDYIKGLKGKKWLIILFSSLVMMTNLTSAIFAALVIIIGFVASNSYRKSIFLAGLWTMVGLLIGFVLTALFFWSQGYLFAFLENTFAFSGALKTLAAKLFPYYGPMLGLDADYYMGKFLQESSTPSLSFGRRFMEVFTNPSYLILLLTNTAIVAIWFRRINQLQNKKFIFGLLLLGLSLPILMLLLGRFVAYYYYMSLLPLILCLTFLFQQGTRICKALIISVIVILCCLEGKMISENSNYSEMRDLINRSSYLNGKVIASPFAPFYEIERVSNKVYYPSAMKEHDLPRQFDYIIIPEINNKADKKIIQLYEKIVSDGANEVRLVTICKKPYLEIYEVNYKNE